MAQHDTIKIPKGQWTQITNANVTAARVQNVGTSTVYIQARSGTGDVELRGAITLKQVMGVASLTMSVEFAGVPSANRLYAYSDLGGKVSISHA